MAVANPNEPNLAASYANIIDALKNQTTLAQNAPPSTAGMIAKVAGATGGSLIKNKIDDNQKKDLETFKNNLQDELIRNSEKYKLQGEGKILTTQEDLNKHYAESGIPLDLVPQIPGGQMWTDPKEKDKIVQHAEFQTHAQKLADVYEKNGDTDKANFLRTVADMPYDKLDSATESLRKVLVPESEKSKNSMTKFTDPTTGEVMQVDNATGETRSLTGPRSRPTDKLASSTDQLFSNEKKTIEKSKVDLKKQAKPLTDVIDKADGLIDDINKNSANTLTNIRAELGQLAGIPGSRMGFKLMQTEGLNPGFAERVEQAMVRAGGKQALSDDNKKALIDYVNFKKQEKVKQLDGIIQDNATSLSLPDVHPDFLKSELGKGYSRYLPTDDMVNVVNPQGVAGKIPRAKLQAAISSGYSLAK